MRRMTSPSAPVRSALPGSSQFHIRRPDTRLPPDVFLGLLMSKKNKKRTAVPAVGPFSGLYSRQILRAIVEALDLGEGHVLTSRTTRRFLRDSNPNGHNRREFFLALGQTLIDMGFVPDLEPHLDLAVSSARMYADSIEFAAKRWDAFMSRIQSESSWDVDMKAAGNCFLRLAVVDLTIRLFALDRITGIEVHLPGPHLWAEENGIGRVLRGLLTDSGLTRGQLAARLEVSLTSVDNWLDGRNCPDERYVDSLALEFAGRDEALSCSLAKDLRRQIALARLCDALSGAVGRDSVISAVNAVSGLAGALSETVGPRFADEAEGLLGSMTFLMGSEFPTARRLLRALAAELPDDHWRSAVLAASVPWELSYVQMLSREGGPRNSVAGLAQDYLDVVGVSAADEVAAVRESIRKEMGDEAFSMMPSGSGAENWHRLLSLFDDAIARRRRLVERFPDSPEAHYQLGSFLGMVGKHTDVRKFVDQGILECRIASGLCPQWDAPAVERGIILTNFGSHEEARQELEQARRELPERTPHWRFAMGYVLMELERFPEGLEHLEAVIGGRGDYALAYNYAARCAFMMGEGVKGRRYAKEAHRLGESEEYYAWERGDYRARR